jgi:signal transduction histidine kinase
MIKLVPDWIDTNKEFWLSLKRRNLFFINLRFVAIAMLISFNFLYEIVVDIDLSEFQHYSIGITSILLLIYNFSLLSVRKRVKNVRGSFNPLHLSLVQILVDLFLLTFLIIITGGIESPLYLFYIFHLIIGSLILPGIVIYSIAFVLLIAMVAITYMQYWKIIPHYCLEGIYKIELYNNPEYIITTLIFFGIMLLVSVFLTNRIAFQLYSQERKLVEALNKINSSELKKQKYIMGVVHEIKSPIAATKSIISLITEGFLGDVSPKIKEKLNRAIIRTSESLEMINNILRISRLRLLDEKTSEDVDIHEIMTDIIDLNSESLTEKNIKLSYESSNNSKLIKGDKVLLRLAFSNLINNAIKYSFKNGIVKISLEYTNNSLLVLITDNGIGIPKDELNKVFENYYRAGNISQNNQEGSGVGLSLVKEIIHQHRGTIVVKSPSSLSTPSQPGTQFKIKIPYQLKEVVKEDKDFLSIEGGL